MVEKIVRHPGVSFAPGEGLVHLWVSGVDPHKLRKIWRACFVRAGLAEPLRLSPSREPNSARHCTAATYPFLPLDLLRSLLEDLYAGGITAPEALERLTPYRTDASFYARSYGLHRRLASARGWVCLPTRFGFYPALVLGIGTHTRIFTMNSHDRVLAPLALAGTNKAYGRDFLAAHGFPVAPGHLVTSAEMAVERARELGFPVVLKRLGGGNSQGILLSLSTEKDCWEGAEHFLRKDFGVIVEKMAEGVEFRLHFVNGRLHNTYRCKPLWVRGNGRATVRDLLAAAYPTYFRVMSASEMQRERLAQFLWGKGVRTFEGLRSYVPAAGERIRVSAAAGARMEEVEARDVFLPRDVARLERFLRQYGAPSAGMDVIMTELRAPLEQAAVILELNVPCGSAYLGDPAGAARAELCAAIGHDRRFMAHGGRVPVWLLLDEEMRGRPGVQQEVRCAFFRRYPRGAARMLSDSFASPWLAVLTDRQAEAFLIGATERLILDHGMPMNLAPVVICAGTREEFRRRFPAVSRTTANARGRLVAAEEVAAAASRKVPPGAPGGGRG